MRRGKKAKKEAKRETLKAVYYFSEYGVLAHSLEEAKEKAKRIYGSGKKPRKKPSKIIKK